MPERNAQSMADQRFGNARLTVACIWEKPMYSTFKD